MEPVKAGTVAGERKAVTSVRSRSEVTGCGALESIDPGAGENGIWGADKRGVQHFRMQCSVPCMPVVS